MHRSQKGNLMRISTCQIARKEKMGSTVNSIDFQLEGLAMLVLFQLPEY